MKTTDTNGAFKSKKMIIIVLAMCAAFAPFSTDMYLPGFHLMADFFNTSEARVQSSLSLFFLGLALGEVIYGPLTDRFGRKPPLVGGIIVYLISTVLCLITKDIDQFIWLRLVQSIGGCGGMVIGRAIINDIFDEKESAKAMSLLMIVMTIAPIIAPSLGGLIIAQVGWKATFVFMFSFALLCLFLVLLFIPETKINHTSAQESHGGIQAWWNLSKNSQFMIPVLVGGFAQCCMFAFITGSSYVLIKLYGVTTQQYGFLYAVMAVAMIVFAQVNSMLMNKYSLSTIINAGITLNIVASIVSILMISSGNLTALLVPLWFALGSISLIASNATSAAMKASGSAAGTGSAYLGVLQFGCAFIVSEIVSSTQNATAYPMVVTILGCAAIGSFLWFSWRRNSQACRL